MMQMVEIAVSFIESFLGIWFPAKILSNEKIDWTKNSLFAAILTILVWWLNQYIIFSMLLTVVGILMMSIGSICTYRGKLFDIVPIVGIYMLFVYACDFFSLSLLGVITNAPEFARHVAYGMSYERSVFLILTKLILIIGVNIVGEIYHKYGIKQYAVKPFYFAEIVLIIYMVIRTLNESDIDALMLWIVLFLLCIIGIYATIQKSIANEAIVEKTLAKEKNKLLQEEHKDFIKAYNDNKLFYHDLKNHYLVLKGLLAQQEYHKAEQYIESINNTNPQLNVSVYTGNEILDLVLSQKVHFAKECGINVSIVSEKIVLPLTELEISSLISNLLDNAIEASKTEGCENWIEIVIRQIRDITFLKISNNYDKEPIKEKKEFVSNKTNSQLHGNGLIQVKSIVKQYNGEMDISYGNGTFSVTISFFIKE